MKDHFEQIPWDAPDESRWRPFEQHGWIWVPTMPAAPETYSLLDADGELMGEVYQRFGRVICWAPFTWAEEAYRSEEDIGEFGFDSEAQRQRHFARIGTALTEWVRRKREAGIDIAMLRDDHAYYFETGNGHKPMTVDEFNHGEDLFPGDPVPSIEVDGWRAERALGWNCEGHWLRDPSGQLRGAVQVRLGVVRAIAAQVADANEVDPVRRAERGDFVGWNAAICRGQIVLRERLRPMARAFADGERAAWLRRAVDAVRSTPNPDRAWPAGTMGAWAGEGQRMFPTSRRAPEQPGAFKGVAPVHKEAQDALAMEDAIRRATCRRALRSVLSVLADRIAADADWWIDVTRDGTAYVGVGELIIRVADRDPDPDAVSDDGLSDSPMWHDLRFGRGAAKAEIRREIEDWFSSEAA